MNKKTLKTIINFIRQADITKSLERNDFWYVYDQINKELNEYFCADFTRFFLEAKIDPLNYLDNIPNNYFNNQLGNDIPDEYVEKINIPGHIKTIGKNAFYNIRVEELKISEGVEILGDSCFYGCYKLKEIYLPSTLTKIGNYAFYSIPTLPLAIEYNGTVDQFKQIQKAPFWWDGFNNITVSCTDGEYIE